MKNIPFDRPEYLLVESLLNRQKHNEQVKARLDSDIEQTCRFLEKVMNLEAGSIGSKYLLTVEGLIEQQTEPPPSPSNDGYKYNDEQKDPDPPPVS